MNQIRILDLRKELGSKTRDVVEFVCFESEKYSVLVWIWGWVLTGIVQWTGGISLFFGGSGWVRLIWVDREAVERTVIV